MNYSDEINRHLNCCARKTTGPQQKVNIEGLTRYVENVARKRLEDLIAFVDTLDTLPTGHIIKSLKITQQIQEEYADLDYAVRSADGFLMTYENSS